MSDPIELKIQQSKRVVLAGAPRKIFVLAEVNQLDQVASLAIVKPKRLVSIADVSSSMTQPGKGAVREPIEDLKLANENALDHLNDQDQFSLYTFASNSDHPLATQLATMNRAQSLRLINGLRASGSTNLRPALESALAASNAAFDEVYLLVTDGDITVGNVKEEQRRCIKLVSQKQPVLWVYGLGQDYDEDFLKELVAAAAPGSFLFHSLTPDQLILEFGKQADILGSIGAVEDMTISFVSMPGVTLEQADRLIPDQQSIPIVDPNRVDYHHGRLDMSGQKILLALSLADSLKPSVDIVIGEMTITYRLTSGNVAQITQSVFVTVTADPNEAEADDVDPVVRTTMLTVRGTTMATSGHTKEAIDLLTKAGLTDIAQKLNTVSPSDENAQRALRTQLTRLGGLNTLSS